MSHNTWMGSEFVRIAPEVRRRIKGIQGFTIAWMMIEAAISLSSASAAHSPALLGFGGDSVIELLSAGVVYWRFRKDGVDRKIETQAARIAGGLLFALATFVGIASGAALLGYGEPRRSLVGIALLVAASMVMPWLAKEKRLLAAITGSTALRADAAESAVCGYLAWITLAGLLANAVWNLKWADPVAALILIPIIVREGWEALRGDDCADY
jgi:divalent metal cation (Fe/Co/Zn/Cd) transporter